MTTQTIKHLAIRLAVVALCGLTFSALAQGRTGGGGGGGGGGSGTGRTGSSSTSTTSPIDRPGNGQVGSASFYVDKDTGQVYVIADAATTAYVSNVVAAMAKPKPQVLIKVVFLEVDYNKGYDFGIQGSITKHLNASTSNTFSSLVPLSAQNASLDGPGLYTVVGDDFSATVRAIEEVGDVHVLSRPVILARNNQMASIQVGDNVPLITTVNFTALGNQENGISYSPVGIILNVTPNITSDGMVEMIVAPQISSVDNTLAQTISYTTNGAPITAPAIAIESANTVVITPDGQTVVIGGLMKNSDTKTDSKIPLLGDIPGIGQLFHHKVKSTVKQELIIFLTPYVVRTPQDLARMSANERSRAEMAPKAFTQKQLNQYLDPGEPQQVPPPIAKPRGSR